MANSLAVPIVAELFFPREAVALQWLRLQTHLARSNFSYATTFETLALQPGVSPRVENFQVDQEAHAYLLLRGTITNPFGGWTEYFSSPSWTWQSGDLCEGPNTAVDLLPVGRPRSPSARHSRSAAVIFRIEISVPEVDRLQDLQVWAQGVMTRMAWHTHELYYRNAARNSISPTNAVHHIVILQPFDARVMLQDVWLSLLRELTQASPGGSVGNVAWKVSVHRRTYSLDHDVAPARDGEGNDKAKRPRGPSDEGAKAKRRWKHISFDNPPTKT